jgi:colicin import membrane protein
MDQEMMNQEVKERIFSAANRLYEQNGNKTPSVSEVRSLAKVNMHDAAKAMKIWRKALKAQDTGPEIPESILLIGNNAIASIWQEANQMATESLRAACSAWETEREELNSIIQEISKEHDAGVNQNQELSQKIEMMQKQIDDANEKILLAEHDNSLSEKLRTEIEHRAKALESELEHAHKENNRLRNEREEARNELLNTKETAARLAGRIDVLEQQQQERKNSRKKNNS